MTLETNNLKQKFKSAIYASGIAIIALTGLLPLALSRTADAAQLTTRSLSISSGVPSASGVTYTFGFTIGAATTKIQSLKFQACTVAVGTCGTVAGLTFASAAWVSQSGFGSNATAFAADATGAGDCIASATILCAKRTTAATETGSTAHTIVFNTITNPSAANTAFFVRMTTYSGVTTQYNATDIIDTGTVTGATVQSLQVNAAVAEILNFCVGSTGVDDATTTPGADCSTITGTSVNLGTLDSGHINITPVTTNCAAADCNKNGIAMVRTNASNGVVVSYDAIQQGGTNHKGTLRVTGVTCDATNPSTINTDQCFQAKGWNGATATQGTITAGTEAFGVTVAGVNCGSTTSYTCNYATTTYNLVRTANYDGTGSANTYNTTDKDQITGTSTNGYAWDESGASINLASSGSSTVKAVDDEALILKFAATPALSTPFGAYTAQSDFTAVATY